MPADLPIAPDEPNRRALILPGGGMRVAWQAGALLALTEEGLRFSYADGASGGTMNLAALLSGIGPADLARRWRSLDVMGFVSPQPWRAYLRFPWISAFGGSAGIRDKVFPHLGIDVGRIRAATGIQATFNVCDFSTKTVVPFAQDQMDRDLLLAGISLPLVTPAVIIDGVTYTDAVWIRDANLLATVRAGANELWVLWCIGNTPVFKNGALNQYVHMIEMSALGALHGELAEIQALNAAIGKGERPFGHDAPIRVHLIRPDYPIPLDPDYLAGRIDGPTLVDQGYRDASRYLRSMQPEGSALEPSATQMRLPGRGVAFREAMTGRLTFGATDPARGYADPAAVPFILKAAIDIRDIEAFRADRNHRAELTGHLEAPRAGGTLPAADGVFALFEPSPDPALTYMVYAMGYRHGGRDYWFNGKKHVRIASPLRLWRATTTLFVTLHEGRDAAGPVVAAGILRLGWFDLVALLGTLHATECEGMMARLRTIGRFAGFFASELWRTYVLRRPLR